MAAQSVSVFAHFSSLMSARSRLSRNTSSESIDRSLCAGPNHTGGYPRGAARGELARQRLRELGIGGHGARKSRPEIQVLDVVFKLAAFRQQLEERHPSDGRAD